MNKKKKCRNWWCFKKATGYIKISAGNFEERMYYCDTHGKMAQEIIKEKYPNGEILLKPNNSKK